MTDQWTVVNRMLNRTEALKLWPSSKLSQINQEYDWCRVKHPNDVNPAHYCTRPKDHTGPHADYRLYANGIEIVGRDYLIWENNG